MATLPQDEPPPRPVGHEQMDDKLNAPRLCFHLPAETDHLRRQPAWREGSGPSSTTLVKHPDLRVVLVAMRQGEAMPEHRTEARITIQVLSGRMRVGGGGAAEELAAGDLLALDREIPHDVTALEDSSFLLTLAWPNPSPC